MIEKMNAAHVPQIARLEQLCFSDPWSEASVSGELENPLSYWLVDTEGDQVRGYVGSQSVPPEADIMNLAVAPDCRGQGIGEALMTAMIDRLKEQGIEALFLEVRPSNFFARKLYEKLNFTEVGRRMKYYVNPVEDALILRKEL